MIDSLIKDDNYSFMNNQKNTLDKSKLTKSEVNYKNFDLSLLEQSVYVEEFGGNYVENGKMIVNIVRGKNDNGSLNYKLNIRGFNDVIYREVDYSMNYLNYVLDRISKYMQINKNNLLNNFASGSVDVINNKVIVELYDLNPKNVLEFKMKVSDSDSIVFRKKTDRMMNEINVNPGSNINVGTPSKGSSSFAYRSTRNGVKGIVLSGHAGKQGQNVYYDGVKIGVIEKSINYGSVDAAFARLTNTNYSISNSLVNHTLSTTPLNPSVGTTVKKKGFKTGTTTGVITNINSTQNWNGVIFTNMSIANYHSAGGDSGGLVYFELPSSNIAHPVGVLKGIYSGSQKSFSKASVVNNNLGTKGY